MKLRAGHKFYHIREERKLSQSEMAELLGISQSAYSRMERGDVSLPLEDLARYADRLGLPLQELLPETMTISNHQGNGSNVVFCNQYNYYGESEHSKVIQQLQEKIEKLEALLREQK
jgi:transcriptional regulator with XRE-family HTH domain